MFAILQLAGSVVAGSAALFGDAMLMLVDAITYSVNLGAFHCVKEDVKVDDAEDMGDVDKHKGNVEGEEREDNHKGEDGRIHPGTQPEQSDIPSRQSQSSACTIEPHNSKTRNKEGDDEGDGSQSEGCGVADDDELPFWENDVRVCVGASAGVEMDDVHARGRANAGPESGFGSQQCKRKGKGSRGWDGHHWASAFSFVSLVATTIYLLVEAVLRLHPKSSYQTTPININIMLFFTLVNLIIDGFMMALFYCFYRPQASRRLLPSTVSEGLAVDDGRDSLNLPHPTLPSPASSSSVPVILALNGKADDLCDLVDNRQSTCATSREAPREFTSDAPTVLAQAESGRRGGTERGEKMNMKTACLHQLSDLIRSVTVLVGVGFVLGLGTEPAQTDAVCAIVVSGTVLVAVAAFGNDLFRHARTSKGLKPG